VIQALAMDATMWHAARGQLVSDVEQASFFLARPHGILLECHAMRAVGADGFECQTDAHLALAGECASELIRWAASEHSCLVELHSHGGGGEVAMSPTDIVGLNEWVPHVRWRLAGVPYAALVQGRTTIDGLVWSDGATPAALGGVLVGGRELVPATGLSHERWYA
jgi:hypothetical protein